MQTYVTGGFMAYAVLYSGFAVLLPELVAMREQGVLKRLRGTPLPLGAFVGAKALTALLMSATAVTLVAMLALAGRRHKPATWSPRWAGGVQAAGHGHARVSELRRVHHHPVHEQCRRPGQRGRDHPGHALGLDA